MEDLETRLKEMILAEYGSLRAFANSIDMSWSTLDSILKRGVMNSNATNIFKITQALNLDADALERGELSPRRFESNCAALTNDESFLIEVSRNSELHERLMAYAHKLKELYDMDSE